MRTPFVEVVEDSTQHTVNYSAQDAAAAYGKRGNYIEVRAEVLFTPSYTNNETNFWRGVSVGLIQKEHIAASGVNGVPIYSESDLSSELIGAYVYARFSVMDVHSSSVQVEVVPPGKGPRYMQHSTRISCAMRPQVKTHTPYHRRGLQVEPTPETKRPTAPKNQNILESSGPPAETTGGWREVYNEDRFGRVAHRCPARQNSTFIWMGAARFASGRAHASSRGIRAGGCALWIIMTRFVAACSSLHAR